jgi:protein gp37
VRPALARVPVDAIVSGRGPDDWTEINWNVATGCTKVSPGCKLCYAVPPLEEHKGESGHPYAEGFELRLWPSRLSEPRRWSRTRRLFVAPLSDLFHEKIPDAFLDQVFAAIAASPQHVFHVITRRAERLARWSRGRTWPSNAWAGVSVESQDFMWRARELLSVPAPVRFLSVAPILGPVSLPPEVLAGVSWVIVSEEHGPRARPAKKAWLEGVFEQGRSADVTVTHGAWMTCPYPARLKLRHLLELRERLSAGRAGG